MTAAVNLDGVEVSTREGVRLHSTTIAIRTGVITAVVGPNGSGKSSLMSVIAGDLNPSTGVIRIAGTDTAEMTAKARAQARSLLSQERQVAFGFTVEDVVSWGRTAWRGGPESRHDDSIIEQALVDLDLVPIRHRAVSTLSGGERTRVHLARVLAQRAPLLLLDEADADLDLVGRAILDDAVRRHTQGGGSAIVVTHDILRARQLASDALVMSQGRVLRQAAASQALTNEVLSEAYGIAVRLP